MIYQQGYFQNLALVLDDHQNNFEKSPKVRYLNCFIYQASFKVKTTDLVGFTLMSGRDLRAEFGPCNRKFNMSKPGAFNSIKKLSFR